MALIRPRLTDHYGIMLAQAESDFAIPFLDEDIPLYLDPFLLWRSPSQQDQALHTAMINSFNHLGYLQKQGKDDEAIKILVELSECNEVGLGLSNTRTGQRIGRDTAREILQLFKIIPEYDRRGFVHFEELQFFVDHISSDRISDFACNFIKSFLIDYTIQECRTYGIPISNCSLPVYNYQLHTLLQEMSVPLPVNPIDGKPVILVPKRWLRFSPWLYYEDYFKDYCPKDRIEFHSNTADRLSVLRFNRKNYGVIQDYVKAKERTRDNCQNDPLFSQIPILSAKKCLERIKALPTGVQDKADRKYEDLCAKLLSSLLYPQLDFAQVHSRTESGALIRDLIFYNTRSHKFLEDVFAKYGSRQLVFEMKNVQSIEGSHVFQLNRYLTDEFGRFGVLLTRNVLSRAMTQNTIDLWAGQRRCIISVTDQDLELMVAVYETKQRDPIDVVLKEFVEFERACPI